MKNQSKILSVVIFLSTFLIACSAQTNYKGEELAVEEEIVVAIPDIITGAENLVADEALLANLDGQRIALLVNPTSRVKDAHIVDIFKDQLSLNIRKIFAPEHGFRGTADAGEKITDGIDPKSKLPVISLYGKHKKPSPEDLKDIDVVIFDVQDVGARFYTYISTLHYVLEACAENNVKLIVLDRPNPNGDVVDGMVLDLNYQSFVGMHPIPVLHGMTIGEYAQMINGEFWLTNGVVCDLEVVPCLNYDHSKSYDLPVKPSPNLPNSRAIKVYPSTCFFEGTVISEGRGTEAPFQIFGAPSLDALVLPFSFTPKSMEGAKYPKCENETCYGFNISEVPNSFEEQKGVNLNYLISMYNLYPDQDNFFLKNGFFDLLAGGNSLRNAIVNGESAEEIKASWQTDLDAFKVVRKKYLLYPDFE